MKNLPTAAAFLAIFGLLMIAGIVFGLFFKAVPMENAAAMNIVLGAAIGWVGSTFAFYYGSNKSSQTKDESIAALSSVAAGTGDGTKPKPEELKL